jgi:hypothetical protein
LPDGIVVGEEDMEFRGWQAGIGGHARGEFVAEVDDHEGTGAMKIQGSEGDVSIRVEAGIPKTFTAKVAKKGSRRTQRIAFEQPGRKEHGAEFGRLHPLIGYYDFTGVIHVTASS